MWIKKSRNEFFSQYCLRKTCALLWVWFENRVWYSKEIILKICGRPKLIWPVINKMLIKQYLKKIKLIKVSMILIQKVNKKPTEKKSILFLEIGIRFYICSTDFQYLSNWMRRSLRFLDLRRLSKLKTINWKLIY